MLRRRACRPPRRARRPVHDSHDPSRRPQPVSGAVTEQRQPGATLTAALEATRRGANAAESDLHYSPARPRARPPDTPRTCRLSSGQLPIRETGSAANKAPHTSASGPSAGIGTTLGLSCGSVLYFIMNQPNNIQRYNHCAARMRWHTRSMSIIGAVKAARSFEPGRPVCGAQ